ncbi:tyrosine-type recombinase/integrase [Bacillus sp. AFS019443]|uniref:tyrosine-type recombinase/integrase n=1 Tax=Bacillus sp. AFS019443 TaxID=2034279 RepID=UPI000BF9C0E3|nr:tyrosine-type recombinase/integrase [Bacillus sp. AFS019443]PEU05840.1 site-specific integrase [Bacillus sp. AFS019443]
MNGSIKQNKKTGKWDFVFNVAKDDITGKRKQIRRRGFISKQAAADEMVKLKAEVLNNDYLELSHMTYGKFMDEWFGERESHLQKSTYISHYAYYKKTIKPKLGHFKIQQITAMNLQRFVNDLVKESHYTENSIRLIFRIISASFKKAFLIRLIKENPTIGVSLPKVPCKEMQIWTLEQVNKFINDGRSVKYPTRYYVGFLIAILAGMRGCEVLGLRWKDVDLENSIIYIRQTLTVGRQLKVGAKNKSSVRSIHIPVVLVEELTHHRKLIDQERIMYGDDYIDLDLVLPTIHGRPVEPRTFRRAFYSLTSHLKLPHIRIHDLRHTHATLLIQQNVNVKLISDRLGHSNVGTTLNTYSHVLPDMQKSVSDKLDEIITKSDRYGDS